MNANRFRGRCRAAPLHGVLLIVMPVFAAHAQEKTSAAAGINNPGLGVFFFIAAIALLLFLLLRSQPLHFASSWRRWLSERKIRKHLSTAGRDVIHDFALPGAYGGTCHIDHALLTKGGIICLLTNHCNGTIFGTPEDPQWLNVDGTIRRKFLNPMIQNETRVRALQKIVPGVPIRNLVVFTGDVHFSAERDKNVIHISQLDSAIAMFRFGPCQVEDWDASWLSVKSAALLETTATANLAQ